MIFYIFKTTLNDMKANIKIGKSFPYFYKLASSFSLLLIIGI